MSNPEDFLKWTVISSHFTGKPRSINSKRIPDKHAPSIQKLLDYIKKWQEETDGVQNGG